MPLYDYICEKGHKFELSHPIADCELPHNCACGTLAIRQMSAPRVRGDYAGYTCPITEKWIEGRKAHEENLKLHGCRVLEPGEYAAAKGRRESMNSALEDKLVDTAILDLQTMPDQKFEILAGELTRGGDVDFARRTLGE